MSVARRTRRAGSAVAMAAAALVACAQPGIPPGGPVDKDAPALVSVSPDTGSLNVRPKSVMIRFDEVINERSTPVAAGGARSAAVSSSGGQQGSTLGSLIVVSPGDGRERVSWRRTAIEIEPRGGFRPNTTYRVTLLPGLGDLRGNTLKERVDVVFSTGATRTTARVSGVLFDWVSAKPAAGARVEVFAPADSTLRWRTATDSVGRFAVQDLAPGSYRLRGWLDTDNDRELDPRELFDSLTVAVDTAASAELYAFLHDTIGPRIETLEPVDSTALRVKFDRGVAIGWTPDELTAVLLRSDSSVVPLGRMIPAGVFDSTRKASAAAADSARRGADSTAARDSAAIADSAARTAGAARAPGRAAPRIEIVREGVALRGPVDTMPVVPPPKMNRPAPVVTWVIMLDAPLAPGTYRLKVRGIPSLTGAVRPSEREFRLRPPAPPADSTKPPAPASPAPRPTRPPR